MKKKKEPQIKQFKVKPNIDDRYYYLANIFPNKQLMQKESLDFMSYNGVDEEPQDYVACVIPYISKTKTGRLRSEIGMIFFCEEHLDEATISHEMVHAALHYDRVINGNSPARYGKQNSDKEERLCYAVDNLIMCYYAVLAYEKKKK
jgi:hypothetical protein